MTNVLFRRTRWSRSALVVVGLLAGACASADAQPVTQRSLSNSYIWNSTGLDANGFHIEFSGVSPESIGEINLTDYPKATVTDMPGGGGTVIEWTGGTTQPGGQSLFGNELLGDASPARVEMHWIRDNEPSGFVSAGYQVWSGWTPDGWVDIIVNYATPDTQIILVERRINTTVDEITLDDLLITGKLWETAKIIDDHTVPIEPGGQLEFVFPWDGQPYINFVMMYNVTDEAGTPIATFLNAVTIVPGPCYPDFTGDGVLDLFDFLEYVNAFNAGLGSADCTGDGALDLFDFLCFVNAFNHGC